MFVQTDCEYYKQNEDWLPTAYAESAYCACSGAGNMGCESRSSACVRGYLRVQHVNFNRFVEILCFISYISTKKQKKQVIIKQYLM